LRQPRRHILSVAKWKIRFTPVNDIALASPVVRRSAATESKDEDVEEQNLPRMQGTDQDIEREEFVGEPEAPE
jgi:hypothetical protein